ncbi:MAG: hypothetical protein AAB817_02950 [Patescibacteria group bacterium]
MEEHQPGGQFEFDLKRIALYFDPAQQNGGVIGGHQLRQKLANQPVFNANLLDWLLAHPHFIPEEWKGQRVFFWGTIYRDGDDDRCVRCLVWSGGRWDWDCGWLDGDFDDDCPAAVSASNE